MCQGQCASKQQLHSLAPGQVVSPWGRSCSGSAYPQRCSVPWLQCSPVANSCRIVPPSLPTGLHEVKLCAGSGCSGRRQGCGLCGPCQCVREGSWWLCALRDQDLFEQGLLLVVGGGWGTMDLGDACYQWPMCSSHVAYAVLFDICSGQLHVVQFAHRPVAQCVACAPACIMPWPVSGPQHVCRTSAAGPVCSEPSCRLRLLHLQSLSPP
jgi:hypothetical protein